MAYIHLVSRSKGEIKSINALCVFVGPYTNVGGLRRLVLCKPMLTNYLFIPNCIIGVVSNYLLPWIVGSQTKRGIQNVVHNNLCGTWCPRDVVPVDLTSRLRQLQFALIDAVCSS